MDSKTINVFFLGKGGVGKSTSSALTALNMASQGYKVLLASMDPAHNQSDIFNTALSEKPVQFSENLSVKEVDIDLWVKKYLQEVENQITSSYSYLTALNLQKYLNVIKYSPGIEEYALLIAFSKIRNENPEKDFIIFDMPPTALTLKFFGLPWLSLIWLEKLLELREEIIRKREIITRVQFGKKEIERDKILNKIHQHIDDYTRIKNIFSDKKKTYINLVMNPDKLSFSESQLIVARLQEYGLDIHSVYLNKYNNEDLSAILEKFSKYSLFKLPQSDQPLLGMEALRSYLDRHKLQLVDGRQG